MADTGVKCGGFLKLWVWNHMLHTCPVLGNIMSLNPEKPNPSWSRGISRYEGKDKFLFHGNPEIRQSVGTKSGEIQKF